MQRPLILFYCLCFSGVFLVSCADIPEESKVKRTVSRTSPILFHEKATVVAEMDEYAKTNTINYTDQNGLKQGVWEMKGWKGRLIEVKTYRNDTLNGYWMEYQGMMKEGFYKNGLKQGFERWFYDPKKSDYLMVILKFEKDEIVWQAHPAADHGQLIPRKGIDVFVDSIYVEVPFHSGQIWYKGLFVNNKQKGTHKIYYPNGQLQGWVNYDLLQSESYDSLGNFVSRDSVKDCKTNYLIIPNGH